jgi:tetratricopeptide (TPR) repeat protein
VLELEQILLDDVAKAIVAQVTTAGIDSIRKIVKLIGHRFQRATDVNSVVAELEAWTRTEPNWQAKLQALFDGTEPGAAPTVSAPPDPFIDRGALLEQVHDRPKLVHLFHGLAGCGMTAFTYKLAERLADVFPFNRCYVDLDLFRANRTVRYREAMIDVLLQLGVTWTDIAEGETQLKHQYLGILLARRVLLIIDNVETLVELTRLAPTSHTCLIIATTRNLTTDLAVRYRPAQLLGLTEDDALTLLADWPELPAMIEQERAQALALLGWFGNMPLAITEIGMLLSYRAGHSDRPIARLFGQLKTAGITDIAGLTAVRMTTTVDRLSSDAKRVFPLLAALPAADFTIDVAVELFDATESHTERLIDELVRASLLTSVASAYRLPLFIRDYARDRAGKTIASRVERLRHYYLLRATAADLLTGNRLREIELPESEQVWSDRATAMRWLDANREALGVEAEEFLRAGQYERVGQLATAMENLVLSRKRYDLAITVFEFAVTAAEHLSRPKLRARMIALKGRVYAMIHLFDEAMPLLTEALAIARTEGDDELEASTEEFIGLYHQTAGDWLTDRAQRHAAYSEAVVHFRRAVEIDRRIGAARAYGIHARMLANALTMLGDPANEALPLLDNLESRFEPGDLRNRSRISTVRAKAYSAIDQGRARAELALAWQLAEQSGSLPSYLDELTDVEAEIEYRAGDYQKARSIWGRLVNDAVAAHSPKSQMYQDKLNWPELRPR